MRAAPSNTLSDRRGLMTVEPGPARTHVATSRHTAKGPCRSIDTTALNTEHVIIGRPGIEFFANPGPSAVAVHFTTTPSGRARIRGSCLPKYIYLLLSYNFPDPQAWTLRHWGGDTEDGPSHANSPSATPGFANPWKRIEVPKASWHRGVGSEPV